MSTLTITLLILALVVIGGVLVYNLVQARKVKDNTPDAKKAGLSGLEASAAHSSVLTPYEMPTTEPVSSSIASNNIATAEAQSVGFSALSSEPVASAEPIFSTSQHASLSEAKLSDTDGIPVLMTPSVDTHSPSHSESEIKPVDQTVLSKDFDHLVELILPAPQPAERLLSLVQPYRRVGAKPIAFDGLLDDGQWCAIDAGQHYVALRGGILMANRHGPLNAMEFSDFSELMSKLAVQLDCEAAVSDLPSVVAAAREVDRRCAELDAQLGINIKTREAISPAMLQSVAAEHGLVERGNGRYAQLDASGATLYTLSFGDSADMLMLLLDVPRSPAHQRPWQQMLNAAGSIAARLQGELVDDAGKSLPPQVWTQIEEQLRERYWALEAAGIVPGSARALRLFN